MNDFDTVEKILDFARHLEGHIGLLGRFYRARILEHAAGTSRTDVEHFDRPHDGSGLDHRLLAAGQQQGQRHRREHRDSTVTPGDTHSGRWIQ